MCNLDYLYIRTYNKCLKISKNNFNNIKIYLD